jgi:F0F1-type ATP synthase assembly protein I
MSGQLEPEETAQPKPAQNSDKVIHDTRGESQVWSAIGSLVAGPAVWGAVGWACDHWFNTSRAFTAAGVVVGFVTSIYIVYVRFGRD